MTSSTPSPDVPPRDAVWRSRAALAAPGACALAGVALFQFFGNPNRGYIDTASLFYWWGFQWTNPGSETEHGWLILGLSAWLLWRNLRTSDWRFSIGDCRTGQSAIGNWQSAISPWQPALAMLAGLAMHALGFVAQQARISILALLLFAWGVLRLGGGRRWGAAAVFPLGFMVFAIPLNVLDSVGFWLRVWVVEASAAIARGAGIAVLQSGTQLVAPDGAYQYDVAAACSGIRSLTAMVALTVLAGYLGFRTWWRRAAGLALCLPLVYAGNVARIVAIIFAAEAGGPRWGDFAHEVMGYGVFVIVLGGVLGANRLLQRTWPEAVPKDEGGAVSSEMEARAGGQAATHGKSPTVGWRRALGSTWGVAAGVVALAAVEMAYLRQLQKAPVRGSAGVTLAADGLNPAELPAFLGTEWIGRRTEISAIEREVLPPDTGYSRKLYVAVADPRQQVLLSIVLSGRDRTSIHRPELCLVGQGWTIVDRGEHRFAFPGRPDGGFPATLLRVRREVAGPKGKVVVPQVVAYWFVGGDRVVASHEWRFLRDAWNRVVRGRADRWAYVLMQTDAADGEPAALARLQAVLDETLPSFQEVFAARVFAPRKP
jgi:EpsI family protein